MVSLTLIKSILGFAAQLSKIAVIESEVDRAWAGIVGLGLVFVWDLSMGQDKKSVEKIMDVTGCPKNTFVSLPEGNTTSRLGA